MKDKNDCEISFVQHIFSVLMGEKEEDGRIF